MMTMNAADKGNRIRDTRWTLASHIRLSRNVRRAMLRRADEMESTDWRLAAAYRHEARAHDLVLVALRDVSRTLRGQ